MKGNATPLDVENNPEERAEAPRRRRRRQRWRLTASARSSGLFSTSSGVALPFMQDAGTSPKTAKAPSCIIRAASAGVAMPPAEKFGTGSLPVCASESFVEFAGYLPDHWVGTGFRVTPAVAFINPLFELRIATAEVHDVFEVPLEFILNAANHKSRQMQMGDLTVEVYDIPFGERIIWGATAGMLLTFRRMLQARTAAP